MGDIRSHRDLVVWQKAVELSLAVYELTRGFPTEERFGLTSQLRRASVSIASNIAEGYGRGTRVDYVRFLRTSRGSLYEVDTQLLIAAKLGYMPEDRCRVVMEQVNECGRVLAGLIRRVEPEQNQAPH